MILDTYRLGYQEISNFCSFSWALIFACRRTQAVKRRFQSRLFYTIEVSDITYPLYNKIPQVSLQVFPFLSCHSLLCLQFLSEKMNPSP